MSTLHTRSTPPSNESSSNIGVGSSQSAPPALLPPPQEPLPEASRRGSSPARQPHSSRTPANRQPTLPSDPFCLQISLRKNPRSSHFQWASTSPALRYESPSTTHPPPATIGSPSARRPHGAPSAARLPPRCACCRFSPHSDSRHRSPWHHRHARSDHRAGDCPHLRR